MADYKGAYLRYMDNKGIKYTDVKEFVVKVTYSGDNTKSIPIYVFFDKDGDDNVQLICWDVTKFTEGKELKAMQVCNDLNSRFRWAKFYIDKDRDIRVECDAYITYGTVGEEVSSLVSRLVNIIDEAYPEFMKALWG